MDIINSVWGGAHTVAGTVALISGAYVLRKPKGDGRHRVWGYVYVTAMTILLLAGIPMADNGISPFHILSIVSGVGLAAGMISIWRTRNQPDPGKRAVLVFSHYKFMAWSYAGLVAAGASQITTRLAVAWGGMATFWWAVVAASLAICGLAAVWIALSDKMIRHRYARALDAGAS